MGHERQGGLVRIGGVLPLAALLFGSACTSQSSVLGSGPDVDACAAYLVYDAFPEPSPTNQGKVVAYAEGMIRLVDRVRDDYKISVRDKPDILAPRPIIDAYARIRTSMEHLRDRANATDGKPDKLTDVANALASDEAYVRADAEITEFYVRACPKEK